MFDEFDQEAQDMLLALHFGDLLWLINGKEVRIGGIAELGDSGLQFSNMEGVIEFTRLKGLRSEGTYFGLTRRYGGGKTDWEFSYVPSYWSLGDGRSIYTPSGEFYSQTTPAQEAILSKFPTEFKSSLVGTVIGGGVGYAVKGSAAGIKGAVVGFAIGLTVGFAQAVCFPDPLPGHQAGDEVLEYWYDNGLYEVTTIRNNRVLETRWSEWWTFTKQ